jgi:hypothetical protein
LGVVVDDAEPLIATFGRSKAQAFFEALALLEPRTPLVIVTYLDYLAQSAHFPNERILKV